MTIDSVMIGLVCTLIGAAIGWAGYRRNATKDAQDEGKVDGAILTDLAHIKIGIDDIKQEQRLQRDEFVAMKVELAKVEASAKQAHRRINDIVGREQSRED